MRGKEWRLRSSSRVIGTDFSNVKIISSSSLTNKKLRIGDAKEFLKPSNASGNVFQNSFISSISVFSPMME